MSLLHQRNFRHFAKQKRNNDCCWRRPLSTSLKNWFQALWLLHWGVSKNAKESLITLAFYSWLEDTSGLRTPISAYSAPWATRLLSRWMLHWLEDRWQHRAWSVPSTHTLPSTRLDRSEIPFFVSWVWPDWDWNPGHHHLWRPSDLLGRWAT